jgi:hypothetical protein
MTDADRAALKDRVENKFFVAGQMDAQGHAAEKFKIGSGGTVLAMSRRLLEEARNELAALLQAAAPPAPTAEPERLEAWRAERGQRVINGIALSAAPPERVSEGKPSS